MEADLQRGGAVSVAQVQMLEAEPVAAVEFDPGVGGGGGAHHFQDRVVPGAAFPEGYGPVGSSSGGEGGQ